MINDVVTKNLITHADDRGFFREINFDWLSGPTVK